MTPFRAAGRKSTKTNRSRRRKPRTPASDTRPSSVRSGGRQATGDALSRAAERVGSLCSVAGHDEVRLMAKRGFGRWLARLSLCASCAAGAGIFSDDRAIAQASDHPDVSIELVDPKTLRVCADPHNLPFSTDKGEGFENKIAELLSAQLG